MRPARLSLSLERQRPSQLRFTTLTTLPSGFLSPAGHSLRRPARSFRIVVLLCFWAGCALLAAGARAEDPGLPTIRSMIGGWLFTPDHTYQAESDVLLPLWRVEPLSVSYQFHEVTPVFSRDLQTQLLHTRHHVVADYTVGESFRLIALGGYERTALEDRAGSLSGYQLGGGVGSALRPDPPRLEWSVLSGAYLSRQHLDAGWWTRLHLGWRLYELRERQMLETPVLPALSLAGDVESANSGGRVHGLYKLGPVLDVVSGNGNRARFEARWQVNDGNPFLEDRYSGLLVGVEVSASLDQDKVFDARDSRSPGWLPLVWGQYDVGYGGDRSLQRTELNAEIHDLNLAGQLITAVLWYESRQEYRPGDFDNVSYSISFGAQTRVGLASVLSQGQPLVFGVEYLHRSAHALDPDADRVPSPGVLPHNSLNLGPRFRLQTLGWDLPYRDPARYGARNAWLNDFDWRLTLGHDFHHSRQRPNPAAQAGLNWDVATLQGSVFYLRGLASVGNETPDWLGEAGVRRRIGKLFFRYERYGLERNLARGNSAVVGLGFHL